MPVRVFQLQLQGPVQIYDPDGQRILRSGKRRVALLVMLCLGGGERTRAWLCAHLWCNRPEEQARSSLKTEIRALKQELHANGEVVLHADRERVWIDRSRFCVDVYTAELQSAPRELMEGFEIAGEELFHDWLREERQRLATRQEIARLTYDARELADIPDEATSSPAPLAPIRIAILPFVNATGFENHDALADGLAEEIALTLTQFASISVVGGGADPSVRQVRHEPQQVCATLQARYLLDGRLLVQGDQVRIWARLYDSVERAQIWNDRFDEPLASIFDLQDRIAGSVARLIDSTIEKWEMRRAIAGPVSSVDAFQMYWRANALFRMWTRASILEAIDLTARVQALEPGSPWAPALGAFCTAVAVTSGWVESPLAGRQSALDLADRAYSRGGDDPQVLGYVAGTQIMVAGDLGLATRALEHARALAPRSASILFWLGWLAVCKGEPEDGLRHFGEAMALNPRSTTRALQLTGMGLSLALLARYEEAVPLLEDALRGMPGYPVTLLGLAVSLARLGNVARAETIAKSYRAIDPQGLVIHLLQSEPHRQMALTGLAIAEGAATPLPGEGRAR
jgi:TolB-like protein